MFFTLIGKVLASTLDINEIANKFSSTTIIGGLNQLSGNITAKVNTTDNTFDIYVDKEKNKSFSYTTDYIEYDNRSAIVTQENFNENGYTMLWIGGIVESIFSLNGYDNMTISEDSDSTNTDFTNTYDTYGIQIETEYYEFKSTNEDGVSWSTSGDYIKYFKISLDTDKIKALMEKFGVPIEEDANENVLKNLTPKLEIKDITENSVTIYSSVPEYTNSNPNYAIHCYIYRSKSKDGIYEKISDMAVNCSDSIGIVDKGLDSNTKYYYKGKIVGTKLNDIGADFSNPISVTTKSIITNDKNTNTEIQDKYGNILNNPKTGISYLIVVTVITGVIAIIILKYSKRKID